MTRHPRIKNIEIVVFGPANDRCWRKVRELFPTPNRHHASWVLRAQRFAKHAGVSARGKISSQGKKRFNQNVV
jgi:hypothetical protein